MKEFWNERYSAEKYVFGTNPNAYFKSKIDQLKPGKLLLPAEGEGRNAVYAAKIGWNVTAFDISEQAKVKAELLAKRNDVTIKYEVGKIENLSYSQGYFDTIGLIFFHLSPEKRLETHRKIWSLLKPGGTLIFQGYDIEHAIYREKYGSIGGPHHESLMYTESEVVTFFADSQVIESHTADTELYEGESHTGLSRVINMTLLKVI
ncbi:MAG: class I SAM-dependent methyltransferase [Bacteroidetes bacterium]|nr:class I SAM-dependent methyltransferase [Bacteroidota bacterium]